MFRPGMVLAGRYRLEERVGAGGMGEVWRATHEALGRTFAVKLMRPALVADPDAVQRFRTEARAMGRVSHPGVAAVHDFHDDPAGAYLVMEFVEGEALSDRLRRDGRLPPVTTMELLAQAAEALQAAHDRELVHRDVKPGNLLLRADGTVVLTDFGIARLRDAAQLTRTGMVVGTPAYLAPEQVLGQPATPLSDVYALGVVGYECLAGRRPFERDNAYATAMARAREPPPPLPDDAPAAVRAAIAHAMAREPAHRWQSAAALATACRQAATDPRDTTDLPGAPTGTPAIRPPAFGGSRPPPAAPIRAWSAKKTVTAIALTALTVATGVVVAVAATSSQRPATRAAPTPAATPPPDLRPSEPAGGTGFDEPLTGHDGWVVSVAVGEVDGTPIAVSAGSFELRVWDLTTGRQRGHPLLGHTGTLTAVALSEVDGVPVAVSASSDRTVRIWDLTTGEPTRELPAGQTGIDFLAVGEIDGIPVVVSGSHSVLRIWDLTTGEPIGDPLTGHPAIVDYLAVGEIDGISVVVSGSTDSTLRIWDLTTGEQIGDPLTGHRDWIEAGALGDIDGTPIAVSGGRDLGLRIWDLTTGEQIGRELFGHRGSVTAVAVGEIDGTPVAVSGSHDSALRIWDLTNGEQIGDPLTGHRDGIDAVALGEIDGVPIAVSGGRDGTVRIWPLSGPDAAGREGS